MSGGTNNKIKQQNKAVEKQYKYDKKYHDYTEKVNQKRYEKARADTILQQANYDAQRLFKDKIKAQQFNYQSDLQKRQFDLDKQVYNQALDDYDDQKELNSMSAAIARASTQRAEREALIKRNFDFEAQDLNQQSQSLDIAENRRGLFQQQAELGFDQRQASSNLRSAEETDALNIRRLSSDFTYATDSRYIQQAENLSNFRTAEETAALDKRQLSSDMNYATDSRYIKQGRNLSDLRSAEETSATNLASLDSKERFQRSQAALEQRDISQEKDFVSDSSRRRVEKLAIQEDKLNEDIRYIEDSSGIDVKSIQLAYNKKQTSNYNKRIEALIKREQEEGKARASGREGLSADRARVDALAAYGRSQAKLVENLVFAKDERTYELGKTTLTRDYQSTLKGKDKDILKNDRSLEFLSRDRQLGKLDINSSKITNALEETVAQIGFDRDRNKSALRKAQREYSLTDRQIDADYNKASRDYEIGKDRTASTLRKAQRQFNIGERKINAEYDKSVRTYQIGKDASASQLRKAQREFGISSDRRESKKGFINQRLEANSQRRTIFDQRNNLANRQIDSTFESAQNQFKADRAKIDRDEYAANLAAHGKIPQRPLEPVALPLPLETPRTVLPMPQAPFKSPKPIKGALGKTSIWNDIGDVANVGLSIAGLFT